VIAARKQQVKKKQPFAHSHPACFACACVKKSRWYAAIILEKGSDRIITVNIRIE